MCTLFCLKQGVLRSCKIGLQWRRQHLLRESYAPPHVSLKKSVHTSWMNRVLPSVYCRVPALIALSVSLMSMSQQAMKVLSKKRLMRQAGFPRKCVPYGRWVALWGECIRVCGCVCVFTCIVLHLRYTFLLVQEDLLLEGPVLLLRVHLSPKDP